MKPHKALFGRLDGVNVGISADAGKKFLHRVTDKRAEVNKHLAINRFDYILPRFVGVTFAICEMLYIAAEPIADTFLKGFSRKVVGKH